MKHCLILFLCLGVNVSAQAADDTLTARAAVDQWLAALDSKDYTATWQSTAPIFQAQVSQRRWKSIAKQARAPLGDAKARELVSANYRSELPGVPSGDYVVFQFRTHFANNPSAIETITPMLVDGRWQVSGYYVQ